MLGASCNMRDIIKIGKKIKYQFWKIIVRLLAVNMALDFWEL